MMSSFDITLRASLQQLWRSGLSRLTGTVISTTVSAGLTILPLLRKLIYPVYFQYLSSMALTYPCVSLITRDAPPLTAQST